MFESNQSRFMIIQYQAIVGIVYHTIMDATTVLIELGKVAITVDAITQLVSPAN